MDGALAVIDEALERCLAVPLWARSPGEIVGYLDAVHRLEQRLAGLKRWDRETHGWLARALHNNLATVAGALDAGTVNVEQARIVAAAVDRVPGTVKG